MASNPENSRLLQLTLIALGDKHDEASNEKRIIAGQGNLAVRHINGTGGFPLDIRPAPHKNEIEGKPGLGGDR